VEGSFASLNPPYGTILADPPWPESGGGQCKRGADRHYPLMKVDAILGMQFDVRRLAAENCHLYLWVTNNFLQDGFAVMDAWGFSYITMITWAKEGNPGLGQYFRGMTEHVLFGRKGQPPYRTKPDGKRAQGTTLFSAPRGKHSEKPSRIHEWAEIVSHGPYLELFARERRSGWDVWGNEVTEFPTEQLPDPVAPGVSGAALDESV
jgi:N6-adenosine-specific RNA methylase IME4